MSREIEQRTDATAAADKAKGPRPYPQGDAPKGFCTGSAAAPQTHQARNARRDARPCRDRARNPSR
jgi:hypothetical protein